MTKYANIQTTLASAVADAGTFTVGYPTGFAQADFIGINAAAQSVMFINHNDKYTEAAAEISVSFGASVATVTNATGATLPSGSIVLMGLAYDGAVAALTDNSGGTVADTIAGIGATYAQAEVANAVASLAAKVNALRDRLVANGLIE